MTQPDAVRRHRIPHTEARHLAMPLGGIGTGNLAIGADGGLRQWQLHNIGNHRGALPNTFFALRISRVEPPLDLMRIIQGTAGEEGPATPLVTDDWVPDWQRETLARFGGFSSVTFSGTYPVAELEFVDDEVPLHITLEALNPLVPLDTEASSIPVAMFTFRIRNTDSVTVHGTLGGALQNAVGWDGISPIDGVDGAGYGGNTNRLLRSAGWTTVVMENPSLHPDAAGAGQMVLAADSAHAAVLPQFVTAAEFMTFLGSRAPASGRDRLANAPSTADPQNHAPFPYGGVSAAGRTFNGGIGAPFRLEPGETTEIRFAVAWHFPNRYVNFEQFGPGHPEWGKTRFWLGNHYTTRFDDAQDVLRRVRDDWHGLRENTLAWTGTLAGSSLNDDEVTHLGAQLSILRSPSCFRTAGGDFFGFEGVLGASTAMWSGEFGGSCPLNCTHVWNYEQALARTFPDLERTMRATEFDVMQSPAGYIPHRVIAPTYLPQMWDVRIGGPEEPALDGMLGTVLKTYREYRLGAGREWLERYWPNLRRLVDHIRTGWDPQGTGVLRGIQPSTHDIDLRGVNSFMGTLWLAALRAAEEIAGVLGEHAVAAEWHELFARGSASYDEQLFNGDYYIQVLDPAESTDFQWEQGCLADQVIGQWWAHELDLGHILPAEHVRSALRAVVRHNLRSGFGDFTHDYRVFADQDDTGLLMCTWPTGGRPAVPTRYADEVWTGSEYQVAAHCLREGLHDEAQQILNGLWTRYDGRRRNPYNQIECGDHYVRAMAGWSVLDALTGFAHNAADASLHFAVNGRSQVSWPFVSSTGWGSLHVDGEEVRLACASGVVELRTLGLSGVSATTAHLVDNVHPMRVEPGKPGDLTLEFPDRLKIGPGEHLAIRLSDA